MALSFPDDVWALVEALSHPLQDQIFLSGTWILEAQPGIEAGVKWNSLSFRTTEWFATLNKNAKDRVEYVFHFGAKARESNDLKDFPARTFKIAWKSTDRCIVTLPNIRETAGLEDEFKDFVRQWIECV